MNIKKNISILVFIVFFSTVAPSYGFATDSVQIISNTVYTSSNTGGKSGADGQDGQNGQSGINGKSVINGESTATMVVETIINGQEVVNTYKKRISEEGASAASYTDTYVATVSSSTKIKDDFKNKDDAISTEGDINRIQNVLSYIRLILIKYVSFLS